MKKKRMYSLFYDEAFHDRKITAKNGEMNIEMDGLSDTFVTAVVGTMKHRLPEFEQKFIEFENFAKQVYKLETDTEFKGTTVNKKFYKFGIRSLNKDAFKVYDRFFDTIDSSMLIQMSFLNKFESVVMNLFRENTLPIYVMPREFYYSITKFLNHYRNKNIVNVLFNERSTSSECLEAITLLMEEVLVKIAPIKRKELEKNAIVQMLSILNDLRTDIRINTQEKIEWSYKQAIFGIDLLMDEKGINRKRVDLIIDEDASTVEEASQHGYKNVTGVKSDECFGVRYADILCNFMGRIVKSIEDEYREDWDKPETIDRLSERRILSEEWFKISEQSFNLYKKVFSIFYTRRNIIWTTQTGVYHGNFSTLMSLLYYFGSLFENYEEYTKLNSKEHREKFNTFSVQREHHIIN